MDIIRFIMAEQLDRSTLNDQLEQERSQTATILELDDVSRPKRVERGMVALPVVAPR